MNQASLVLVAGGSGSRLGGTPKQFRLLAGQPVWLWSVLRLHKLVASVVIVAHPERHADIRRCLDELSATPIILAASGAERQHSVDNGIQAALDYDPNIDAFLVHDAARPFITPQDTERLLQALVHEPAAILADRCSATVKQIDPASQSILRTVPRDDLALASTPQALRRSTWQQLDPAILTTDEASRCEAAGIPVRVIWASQPNPKITTTADWALAQTMAQSIPLLSTEHS